MDKICAICGEPITDNQPAHQDNEGNYYHDECIQDSDDFFICPECDTVYSFDDSVEVDNEFFVCMNCAEQYYNRCDDCGGYFTSDNLIHVEDDLLCANCFDRALDRGNIDICADCGEYHYTDNMHYDEYDGCYYCHNCRDDDSLIRSYHDNPALKMFPPTDEPHFGIELEVDEGDDPTDLAKTLQGILGNHAYYMHDGSLDCGVEIITQPHTPEEFYKMPWDKVLTTCLDNGFKSHDAGTCGLHMHVSRSLFKDDDAIYRIIYFYEHYIADILKMSRRTHSQMDNWASTYGWGDSTFAQLLTESNILPDFNYGDHGDRYYAVNITNDNTIEFRLMRGTLNYKTFMATIDFLWTTANNAATMTNDDVTNVANYLKGIKKETLDYLHSRNAFLEVNKNICA